MPLEKTSDPKINTLIDLVNKYKGSKIKDNPYNALSITPRIMFIALSNLSFPNTYVWAAKGAITDDALVNPRIKDDFVIAEVHLGTAAGTGLGYNSEYSPIENGLKSLEPILEGCIKEARRKSYRDYYTLLSNSGLDEKFILHNLAAVEPVQTLNQPHQKRISTKRLKQLARQCSEILSVKGNDGRVRIAVHDEVRRYVNSQGTAIMDYFFGYHLRFMVQTLDVEKRKMEFVQNLYYTDAVDWPAVLKFVHKMARKVEERKDCPVINSGMYDILFSPPGMATQLHECFVHLLASDMILDENSTVWGWENHGRQVANPKLNVSANPGLPGKWGSMLFDYEGIPAQKRVLVENGVVLGYLADRNGAYHLSQKTKSIILPGDARFQIINNNTLLRPQPRISNLEITWKEEKKQHGQSLRQKFLSRLRKSGKNGLYIPDSSGAGSYVETSQIEAYPYFPEIVTPEGKFIPTKFIKTYDTASRFVNNIQEMDSKKIYCGQRCGDGETMAIARAGVICGSGIVKDVYVNACRPEQRKI